MSFEDFKRLNRSIGNFWFDESTMRFFSSRIVDWCSLTGYFISSERGPHRTNARKYTIRHADFKTGRVRTVGEFQQYATLSRAKTRFKNLRSGKCAED